VRTNKLLANFSDPFPTQEPRQNHATLGNIPLPAHRQVQVPSSPVRISLLLADAFGLNLRGIANPQLDTQLCQ
jgi:hypothetical protein